jgi:hypothetical protein
MKINGINLHSTFPGEIQLLTTYDTLRGVRRIWHIGRERTLGNECSVSSFKGSARQGRQAVVAQGPLAFVSLCWTIKFLAGRIRLRQGHGATGRQGTAGHQINSNEFKPFQMISNHF